MRCTAAVFPTPPGSAPADDPRRRRSNGHWSEQASGRQHHDAVSGPITTGKAPLCVRAVQVSDGAAVTLLMTRREALRRGLPVLGVFRSFAAVGVDPAIMGVGPAVAIPEAVRRAGLTLDDIDVYEINEAFASQALYCVRDLGLDPEKVWLPPAPAPSPPTLPLASWHWRHGKARPFPPCPPSLYTYTAALRAAVVLVMVLVGLRDAPTLHDQVQ